MKMTRRDFLKSSLAGAVVAATAGALSACGESNSGDQGSSQKTLKLSHTLAEDHAVHIAMTAFAKAVEEATNGEVKIQIFANGTLGNEVDNIASMKAGTLDMAKVSAATLGNYYEKWNAMSVPYVFNNKDHFFKVMDSQIIEDLYMETAGDGYVGLTWLDSGSRSFYTKSTPIHTPADLKGLKIRTMDSQMAIDMMTALGGSSVPMGYGDIYNSLQTGVIDGAENNPTALRDHGEVAKFYSYDEHTIIPDIVLISTKAWNSLTEDQQKAIKKAAADMKEDYKVQWKAFEDEVIDRAVNEMGVTMVKDVDKQAIVDACASIYENVKKDSPDTYALIEAIRGIE